MPATDHTLPSLFVYYLPPSIICCCVTFIFSGEPPLFQSCIATCSRRTQYSLSGTSIAHDTEQTHSFQNTHPTPCHSIVTSVSSSCAQPHSFSSPSFSSAWSRRVFKSDSYPFLHGQTTPGISDTSTFFHGSTSKRSLIEKQWCSYNSLHSPSSPFIFSSFSVSDPKR